MLPSFFYQTPFFRILLPVMAGIIVGFQITVPLLLLLSAATALVIILYILCRKRKKIPPWAFGIGLSVFLFTAGICLVGLHYFEASEQTESGIYLAVVEEPPSEKQNTVQAVMRIRGYQYGNSWVSANEKIQVYFQKDTLSRNTRQGDLLVFETVLTPVTLAGNPYEFNYPAYLNRKNIGRSAFVESGKWRQVDHYAQGPLKNLSNRIRNYLLDIYQRAGLSGNELAVASALTLGYKADLDEALRGAYSASGAMHVLAVSGLHVGILYVIMHSLLQLFPFLQRKRWIRTFLLLGLLWSYALITGMSPSVMRAVTMFSFIVVGEALHRKAYTYNSIAASAFILLLFQPGMLFDVGFQFSYMAVLAIVFLQPWLYRMYTFKYWLPAQAWSLTCVSVAAQVGTAPLSIYYFHQFPNYFLLSNFLVIPGATIILYGGLLLMVIAPLQVLTEWVGWVYDKFIYLLNTCIFFIEKLPGSVILGIRFQAWEVLVAYGLVAVISIWALTARKTFFFLALGLCLFWLSGTGWRYYNDLSRQQLIVYHAPGSSLIQFIEGRSNVIWSDSRRASFNASVFTDRLRTAMQLDEAYSLVLDSALLVPGLSHQTDWYQNGNYIQFAGKRLAIFTGRSPLPDAGILQVKTDVVVLAQNTVAKIDRVIKSCMPELIVIDASNSVRRADEWEQDCLRLGVKCHRVSRDGAFMLQGNP